MITMIILLLLLWDSCMDQKDDQKDANEKAEAGPDVANEEAGPDVANDWDRINKKSKMTEAAKNLAKRIYESIKGAEAAPKGREIVEIRLNTNKPEARELATALGINGYYCACRISRRRRITADRFPKKCGKLQCILIQEGEAEEKTPLAPGTEIAIVRLKGWRLSMIVDSE